jgi:hypothetical protein
MVAAHWAGFPLQTTSYRELGPELYCLCLSVWVCLPNEIFVAFISSGWPIKPSPKDELRIMKSLRGKPFSIMFLGFNSLLLQQAEGN